MVHIPILSPLLFRQSLYIYSLFLYQRIFYLLVSLHFYCPRLSVVVYKDVHNIVASEEMVADTYVPSLIVIDNTIKQLETTASFTCSP